MSVGYLANSFDMINVRDLDLIAQARERCSSLLVGVFTDDYVEQHFGRGPVAPLDERIDVVRHIGGVAEAVQHDDSGQVGYGASVLFAEAGSPVTPRENLHWLTPRTSHGPRQAPGVVDRPGIRDRHPDGVVGYVPGAWDMFHVGHLNILRRARENCDRLIVGVVTDDALHQVKGKHPVIPLDERMEVVANLTMVDDVVVDRSADKLAVWQEVGFDMVFKGDDWRGTPKGDKLEADMASVGVTVCYFPYTKDTSSSLRRAQLSAR